MSQGDLYAIRGTDRRGIEVRRDGDTVHLAEIRDNWPFPSAPVPHHRDELKRLPMKYYQSLNDISDLQESPL